MKTSAFALAVVCAFTTALTAQAGQQASEGVLIKNVVPNSAAAQVGLQAGDRILAIDGLSTEDAFDMAWAISSHNPGARLNLQVLRGGKTITVEGMLGRRVQSTTPVISPASMRRPAAATPVYQYTPADINDQHAYGG